MIKLIGCGTYSKVAKAKMLGYEDYVAIKRICGINNS
jgi:hypothetical protein